MASADFLQFVVTAAPAVCKTSRDKSSVFPRLPSGFTHTGYGCLLGLRCLRPSCPPCAPSYPVSVRRATISLLLLLACTSRCKPCNSLWGSSATTPLVDFHHRLTACPSYIKMPASLTGILLFLLHCVCAVRQHYASLFHIAVHIVHYRSYPVSCPAALYRTGHFDSPVEIALHDVS